MPLEQYGLVVISYRHSQHQQERGGSFDDHLPKLTNYRYLVLTQPVPTLYHHRWRENDQLCSHLTRKVVLVQVLVFLKPFPSFLVLGAQMVMVIKYKRCIFLDCHIWVGATPYLKVAT